MNKIYTGGYVSADLKDIIILLNDVKYGHILVNEYYKKYKNVHDIERNKIKFDWIADDGLGKAISKSHRLDENYFNLYIKLNVADEYIDKNGMLQKVIDKRLYERKIKQEFFKMYKQEGGYKINMSCVHIWDGIKVIRTIVPVWNILPEEEID